MSLFGKVVAVLNILAAGAFLYLMASTLQRRTAWSHAVWRYDLNVDGLPVDRNEPDDLNRPREQNIPDTVVEEMTGNKDVRTQEEFLNTRQQDITARIDDPSIRGSKIEKLVEVLVPLATSAYDRDQLLSIKQNPGAFREQDLRDRLSRHFDGARNKPNQTPRDRDAKKQAIGRILINLAGVLPNEAEKAQKSDDPINDPVYRRVVAVIGLKNLASILAAEADLMLKMDSDVTATRNQERVDFADRHQELIHLLIQREYELRERLDLLEDKKEQVDKQEKRALAQEAAVTRVQGELAAAQAKTAEELDKLAKQQERLYQLRLRLRDANRVNQELERKVRELETKKP